MSKKLSTASAARWIVSVFSVEMSMFVAGELVVVVVFEGEDADSRISRDKRQRP